LGPNPCGIGKARASIDEPFAYPATFCFLTLDVVLPHVSVAIGVKHFQDSMADNWMGDKDNNINREMRQNETLTKQSIMNLSIRN
jgi:hypothetical protein